MTRTLLLAAAVAFTMQSTPVKFTTLARDGGSQIEEERKVVVRSTGDWAKLWKEHAGEAKPPAVDFNTSMVIAVFAGSRPTAGYTVEFESMETKGTTLFVRYRVRSPKADEMVAQVLTAPFHIVRVDAHPGSVTFVDVR